MRTILMTLPALLLATAVPAQTLTDVVDARLLPGWRTAEGVHVSGLELRLAKGWKTYWRSPGDAGIPPQFDWAGSDNVADVAVSWPVPSVFLQGGMRSVGYDGTVILPLTVRPRDATGAAMLSGTVDLGVCEEVCIPVRLNVAVDLPAGKRAKAPDLAAALANRPMTEDEARVRSVDCSFAPIADGLRVSATVEMPAFGVDEVAVLELADPSIWVAEPDISRSGDVLSLVTEVVPMSGQPFALARDDVRVTIIAGGQAVDIQGCG